MLPGFHAGIRKAEIRVREFKSKKQKIMDRKQLIEKYKAEWSKAKAASTYKTVGGYEKVKLEERGKMEAFAMILDDLLLNGETAKDLPCTCENQKLGQTTCDKSCVDADQYS